MHLPLYHVNAFPIAPFGGNPAAVCLLDSWLDDSLLLKVATENSVSATAFLVKHGNGYEIRWFTSKCEVRLCGHATFASGYIVLTLLQPELNSMNFETKYRGAVSVRKDGNLLVMDFPALSIRACAGKPPDLRAALGIDAQAQEVLEGDDSFVAVFDDEDVIRKIEPSFERLEQLHPNVVMVTAPGRQVDFVSRYFAPGYGVPEDPVTGSAHCALAPYWAERLGKKQLHARQLSDRGGELSCELSGDRVLLKGNAVLTLKGELKF